MEFTFISGTIEQPIPQKVDDHTYLVLVKYRNKKAIVTMPVKLTGQIANYYLKYINGYKGVKSVFVNLLGNLFITKEKAIFVDCFRLDIANADGLYEGLVRKATSGLTHINKKGEKKYARKKTINTNNGTQ